MDGGYLPPPPAYSEQEFDQKVANVAEISLTTPQPDYSDDDLWEDFDEAAYERAAAALAALNVSSQGSGSNQMTSSASSQWPSPQPPNNDKASKPSSGGIEPLRVEKKSKLGPADTLTKPRPSWLAKAERMPPSQTAGSSSTFIDGRDHTVPMELHNDDEDRSSPPPSFEAEGPSWGNHIPEHAAPLHYGEGGSTQASPLSSPQPPEAILPPQSSPLSPLDVQFQTYIPNHHHIPHIQNTYNQLHGRPPRQSLPVPPVQQVLPEPRPTSSFSPPTTQFVPSPPPQMDFNPSVAYGTRAIGHELPVLQQRQQPRQQQQQYRQPGPPPMLTFDPKAFYNSAVSAHLSAHDRTTQASRPYSSIPSQHGLQNMQPPTQSYNQQTNSNYWPQGNNALGVYAPNHPMIPSSQPRPLVQPHPTYPNQPSFPTSAYGANNNQWSDPNPNYSGYHQ